nr:skin secretory protein xP2 isoform X2 [Oryctolagus cuniculus]
MSSPLPWEPCQPSRWGGLGPPGSVAKEAGSRETAEGFRQWEWGQGQGCTAPACRTTGSAPTSACGSAPCPRSPTPTSTREGDEQAGRRGTQHSTDGTHGQAPSVRSQGRGTRGASAHAVVHDTRCAQRPDGETKAESTQGGPPGPRPASTSWESEGAGSSENEGHSQSQDPQKAPELVTVGERGPQTRRLPGLASPHCPPPSQGPPGSRKPTLPSLPLAWCAARSRVTRPRAEPCWPGHGSSSPGRCTPAPSPTAGQDLPLFPGWPGRATPPASTSCAMCTLLGARPAPARLPRAVRAPGMAPGAGVSGSLDAPMGSLNLGSTCRNEAPHGTWTWWPWGDGHLGVTWPWSQSREVATPGPPGMALGAGRPGPPHFPTPPHSHPGIQGTGHHV